MTHMYSHQKRTQASMQLRSQNVTCHGLYLVDPICTAGQCVQWLLRSWDMLAAREVGPCSMSYGYTSCWGQELELTCRQGDERLQRNNSSVSRKRSNNSLEMRTAAAVAATVQMLFAKMAQTGKLHVINVTAIRTHIAAFHELDQLLLVAAIRHHCHASCCCKSCHGTA